jgi:hypothetical protein
MAEITDNVNWIAVIVGAVVAFLLGWLWYSPKLFGTKWAEGAGVKIDSAQSMPMAAMLVQAIATFLLAWVVGVTAAADQLLFVILIILTIGFLFVAGGLFSQKSRYTITTEVGFVAAMAVIMIVCQGIF